MRLCQRIAPFLARTVSAIALLAVAAVCLGAQAPAGGPPPASPADRGLVLVELFTSEGCPHCPEADALLEKMYSEQSIEGAQIIALEEHVDYWDRPSWVDHFSSPAFTARQQNYADAMDLDSLYTPQMVVDGLVEFVGNNAGRARSTISALGRAPLPAVRIAAAADDKKAPAGPQVRLEVRGLAPATLAEVYLVLAEDKLTSRVSGGRNAGENWAHSSVARWVRLVGRLPAGTKELSLTAVFEAPQTGWRAENLRLIAFVQETESQRILAVGAARLADVLPHASAPPQNSGYQACEQEGASHVRTRFQPCRKANQIIAASAADVSPGALPDLPGPVPKRPASSSNALWTCDPRTPMQAREEAAEAEGQR
jgi:hypothetical protein